jgi:hypothetical protein
MSFVNPSVAGSGLSPSAWAQFQAAGLTGLLDLVIRSNSNPTPDPTAAATVAVTGGGATGGQLAAGAYYARYCETNGIGSTGPSPEVGPFTVAAGNIPSLSFPALQAGNVARDVYLSPAGGVAGTELLYQRGVTAGTFNLAVAAPSNSYPAPLPAGNTTALGFHQLELLKGVKRGSLQGAWGRAEVAATNFMRGDPTAHRDALRAVRDSAVVIALVSQAVAELGGAIEANPGTMGTKPLGTGLIVPRRSWP